METKKKHFTILNAYKFFKLKNLNSLKKSIYKICKENNVNGTILVAKEGMNIGISGYQKKIDRVFYKIKTITQSNDWTYIKTKAQFMPFYRMKVRIKKEIVTIGKTLTRKEKLGTHVGKAKWDKLLNDPNVLVIDARNKYETEIGTFKNAIDLSINKFTSFPNAVKKILKKVKKEKIAMFCTGGIRCEKASSFLLEKGYTEIYQLKGGILNYFKKSSSSKNLWNGECFVFDNRVALNKKLKIGTYDQCHGCRFPITDTHKKDPRYVKGVSCPHCYSKLTKKKESSRAMRQKQIDKANKDGKKHPFLIIAP